MPSKVAPRFANGAKAMQAADSSGSEGFEFRLTVWPASGAGWRARVVAPDDSRREFASPFELARYLAWPLAPVAKDGKGLR